MPPSIASRPDHVAVGVPELERAATRWRDELGGGLLTTWDNGVFAGRQYRFRDGGKVELLTPSAQDPSPDNFVRSFLARFGARVHHLTLRVADIDAAIAAVRDGGYDVVDVDTGRDHWKEGFLRPTQVGGLVVQLGWSPRTDDEWATERGTPPQPPRDDGAVLVGPRLRHPDLGAARELWELLGAKVDAADGALVCRWPEGAIEVVVEEGEPAGPVALRFAAGGPLSADDVLGPRVERVEG